LATADCLTTLGIIYGDGIDVPTDEVRARIVHTRMRGRPGHGLQACDDGDQVACEHFR
jgi:hypothetical protein